MAENALMGKMGGAGIGSFDGSSFNRSEGPGMMGVANQAIGLARQSTGYEHEQLNLHTQRLGILNSHLASLANDPVVQAGGPDAMKKITEAGGRLVAMGIVPAKQLTIAIGGIDPANPMPALRQAQLNTLEAGQRVQTMYGAPQNIDSGSGIQTQFVSPFNNRVTPAQGGYVQRQLTPGERIAPVAAPPGPNGEQRMQPAVGFGATTGVLGPDGNLPPQRPGNPLPMQQPQRQPAPVTAPQAGFQPSAIPMPTQPARGVQQPARVAQNPYGAVTTGLPPGQPQAQTVDLEAGANQGVALQKAVDTSPQRMGQLSNLEKNLAQFESGPQAERARKIKGTVNQVGSLVGVQPFDAKSLAAQESFVKESTMLAQQQFAALGGTGTDQQLGSALKSNPSEALSKEGNKNIIAMLKGNEAALNAKNDAWQQWKQKNGAGSYPQFSSEFNKGYSPRAFQFAFLPPEERAKMLSSMSPSEKSALGAALKNAEERGWIRPDGQKSPTRAQ